MLPSPRRAGHVLDRVSAVGVVAWLGPSWMSAPSTSPIGPVSRRRHPRVDPFRTRLVVGDADGPVSLASLLIGSRPALVLARTGGSSHTASDRAQTIWRCAPGDLDPVSAWRSAGTRRGATPPPDHEPARHAERYAPIGVRGRLGAGGYSPRRQGSSGAVDHGATGGHRLRAPASAPASSA